MQPSEHALCHSRQADANVESDHERVRQVRKLTHHRGRTRAACTCPRRKTTRFDAPCLVSRLLESEWWTRQLATWSWPTTQSAGEPTCSRESSSRHNLSDTSERALAAAVELAREHDAALRIVHVVNDLATEPWAVEAYGVDFDALMAEVRSRAGADLAAQVTRIAPTAGGCAGASPRRQASGGDPAGRGEHEGRPPRARLAWPRPRAPRVSRQRRRPRAAGGRLPGPDRPGPPSPPLRSLTLREGDGMISGHDSGPLARPDDERSVLRW